MDRGEFVKRLVFLVVWMSLYTVGLTIGIYFLYGSLTAPLSDHEPFLPSLMVVLFLLISFFLAEVATMGWERGKAHVYNVLGRVLFNPRRTK